MIRILGRISSINVQKVMWCADEIGAKVERVDVGGKFKGNDTPEYLAKNPMGLVPTLEDGEFVMWESNAIVRYLADAHGKAPWQPADAKGRGIANQWMDWYLTAMHPPMTTIFLQLIRTKPEDRDMKAFEDAAAKASKLWTMVDGQLARRPYLTGDQPTIGDIPAGCSVNRWYVLDVKRPKLPNLEAWYERLKARPAYGKHVTAIPLA
ncbi:MAG TPA: glutathione S-transferase family protein [Rhodospirillales bacterium]|jgi:glutathione S-transferase